MSDPIEILERRIKETIDELNDAQGLHFFCQVGGSNDERGIITFQISGSGRALLSWRLDDEDSELWSVLLSPPDLKRFHRLLLQHRFWTATPARRPRRGDETNFHLRLSDQTAGTYNGLQFWSEDMDEFPVLRDLMSRLARIIRAVSDDELVLDEFEAADA